MAITKEEIIHVAELSRLSLSEDEITEYQTELSAVLGYIENLNEVDIKGVEATAQVSGLVNVWRADDLKPWNEDEVALALAQGRTEGGQIKVKRVL